MQDNFHLCGNLCFESRGFFCDHATNVLHNDPLLSLFVEKIVQGNAPFHKFLSKGSIIIVIYTKEGEKKKARGFYSYLRATTHCSARVIAWKKTKKRIKEKKKRIYHIRCAVVFIPSRSKFISGLTTTRYHLIQLKSFFFFRYWEDIYFVNMVKNTEFI